MSETLAAAVLERRWADALAAADARLTTRPDDPSLLYVRGVALRNLWRMDEAIDAYRRSIAAGYEGIGPYRELFQHLDKRGRIDEALEVWRQAHERGYSTARFHSMALDARLKRAGATAEELLAAHREWVDLYAHPDPSVPPLDVAPFDGTRPLRVGYVCSFWEAPTIRFILLPVLKRHDRRVVQPYLYVTEPLRSGELWREMYEPHVAGIREVAGLSDRDFVACARGDRLDILIELNGHSGNHRYVAMASRCAPVQAVYLNYTSTTAVPKMDAILGDEIVPPRQTEGYFTETVTRIEGCFLSYDYSDDPLLPPVAPPPHAGNGFVTFGSFGATTKLSDPLLDWWCAILAQVPDARLFIRNFEMSPPDNRRALERRFVERGLEPTRLRLVGKGTRHDVVRSYADVDIALDTWPYCGGNTTAEALWQGVPVVTLQGARFSSAYGGSLLRAAGCPELVASTADEYVRKAVALAQAPARLAAYRRSLRAQVVAHGLGNAEAFTRRFEKALVAMRQRAVALTA